MKQDRKRIEPDLFANIAIEDPFRHSPGHNPNPPPRLEARELEEAVSRRTRNLLLPEPILDVERTKSQRDADLSRHDFRLLCLVALDTVIDRMGFGSGASRRDVQNALVPILRASEPDITADRERLVVDLVLDALLNERGRRQRFTAKYAVLEGGAVRWLEFEYALLEERQTDDGEGRVFRASKEAINLYTSMLGLDLEDAAVADAAVLRYQAERGRLDDAIQTAHQAQIRAKAYAEHIRLRLEIARRDVEQAAWVGQVLPVIDEALRHITDRLEKERELRCGLEQRRDQASGEDLAKLTRLLNEIEKSERTNLDLHRLLLTANQQFRDEHARQRLRRPSAGLLPNLEADVLLPWLGLPITEARERFVFALNVVAGVHTPCVTSLDTLWNKLLAPPIIVAPAEADTVPPETTEMTAPPPPFAWRDFEISAQFLRDTLTERRRLSELLITAEERALPPAACRLVVLLSMQQFGAAAGRRQFHVESAGDSFATDGFSGDDLVLSRA